MSYWTHLRGTITVCPMGRTSDEREYVLKTVLKHLPIVSGTEKDMATHVVPFYGYNSSCTCNEFMEPLGRGKWFHEQSLFHIVVEGDLRDRMFAETLREFTSWLCRLAKRVWVEDVQVCLSSSNHDPFIIQDLHGAYYNMFEDPSWCGDHSSVNWCEYLMWDRERHGTYPAKLVYKYCNDPENDERVEAWMGYE